MTTARDATWSPWQMSRTLRLTRSQPRSLLSIPRLKRASSRTRLSICRRTRSAQMSLSLKGAFLRNSPTSTVDGAFSDQTSPRCRNGWGTPTSRRRGSTTTGKPGLRTARRSRWRIDWTRGNCGELAPRPSSGSQRDRLNFVTLLGHQARQPERTDHVQGANCCKHFAPRTMQDINARGHAAVSVVEYL